MTDTTTEAGFYRLTDPDGQDPVMFCAGCALTHTNPVLVLNGIRPALSMAEATAILHTQMALRGENPDDILSYHEHGKCELCEKES